MGAAVLSNIVMGMGQGNDGRVGRVHGDGSERESRLNRYRNENLREIDGLI